jgi:hypothetical protein
VLQNVLVAQNLSASGGTGGAGGAGGIGTPSGYSGYAGSSGSGGAGNDLLGVFSSNGHNLISLDEGSSGFINGVLGDIVGSGTAINAMLGALTNNGGPTLTCALLFGSPAIDAGDDTLLGAPWNLMTDQRGLPRKSGTQCDIGAFEIQWPSNPFRFASCTRSADGSIQITVTNVHGANLTMLAATNVYLPLPAWTVLGQIPEIAPGYFQYEEPAPVNSPVRFYRIRCP